MASREQPPGRSRDGTTRSPADRDIFRDDGPRVPVKDRPPEEKDKDDPSSGAGGVD